MHAMTDPLIESFPFLQTVPRASREAFLAQSVRKSLEHKQVLVRDGNECAYLPFVLEGTLRLFKSSETGRELTLYRIERGESCILTATCILNGTSFPAIAEAEGSTRVLLAPAKLLVRFVEEHAEWRRFVFGLYSKRLDIVLSLVDEVAFQHIDERIAGYLLKHAVGSDGAVTTTHVEIASELGTSREVVTRILRDFEAAGMIETRRGSILIRRRAELEGMLGTPPLA
jgi:CRP/FNR family transcriptional regulator, anaerobic regulatory protein